MNDEQRTNMLFQEHRVIKHFGFLSDISQDESKSEQESITHISSFEGFQKQKKNSQHKSKHLLPTLVDRGWKEAQGDSSETKIFVLILAKFFERP